LVELRADKSISGAKGPQSKSRNPGSNQFLMLSHRFLIIEGGPRRRLANFRRRKLSHAAI
jgi:hypothetical protein